MGLFHLKYQRLKPGITRVLSMGSNFVPESPANVIYFDPSQNPMKDHPFMKEAMDKKRTWR